MLGIHGVGRDGADYYLSDPALELPVPVAPTWVGGAAAGLGLEGVLQPADFERLLRGDLRPGADGRGARGERGAGVAAYDLTFSAPKSASVLFALGGRDVANGVVAAHLDGVAGALVYLEGHGLAARRRSGSESTVIPTSGMVAASFTHAVNRNGDPHLHSHVVMANLVHGSDGRWSACDRRGIDAHRHAAAAVYEAHLRAGLTHALGMAWSPPTRPGRAAEIAGIPASVLGEFSSRGADIRRRLYEVGAHSSAAGRIAWAGTRPDKGPARSYVDLAGEWSRRAAAAGPGLELDGRPGRRLVDEHAFAAVISLTPHGGAHRRDVVRAFGAGAPDGIEAGALERLVTRSVPAPPVPARGVAEPLMARRAVVPTNHALRALGPRPLDSDRHTVWADAATVIDGYRERWGVGQAPEPLGVDDTLSSLAALPVDRLADHIQTARHLEEARTRLGLRPPVTVELGLGR